MLGYTNGRAPVTDNIQLHTPLSPMPLKTEPRLRGDRAWAMMASLACALEGGSGLHVAYCRGFHLHPLRSRGRASIELHGADGPRSADIIQHPRAPN